MLTLPTGIKVFISKEPVNMNKSFDGLASLITNNFNQNPQSGTLFIFFNRYCNKVKILYWDRNGFAIWYKRLESGKYRLPTIQQNLYKISISDLNLLLEGIDLNDKNRN